jgi:hypothetical protein
MGTKIIAHYNDNSESDTYTLASGELETFTKTLNTGVEVSLEWKKGSGDAECGYTINYKNGAEIYSGKGTQKGIFFSWVNNCSSLEKTIKTGEAVKNFDIEVGTHSATLKWEKPETEGVKHYEIYRETMLIDTTLNLYYKDENLVSGSYTYNVRPVYEDCFGATSTKEIAFCEGVEEMFVPNVTIYPNPASDRLYVETQTQTLTIEIYDVYGRLQDHKTTRLQGCIAVDVVNLNSGIYFVKVVTENGNVVKRIVKY